MSDAVKQYPDVLTSGQRLGEALIIVGLLALAAFFIVHQTSGTGFFNEKFGTLEMILLYAPLLLAIAAAGVQVVTGQHQPARLFEAAGGLLLGAAALWFLIVFPFDFTHLADALPQGLRFLLAWVTNDIGRIPLIIQVIAGPVGAFQAIRALLAGLG